MYITPDYYGVRILVRIKKLIESAQVPTYATSGSACFDISAAGKGVIEPGEAKIVETGLVFEIPEGHVMLLFSRSGHGFKNGVRLSNSVGVIDSDYRGEVKVKLHNDGTETFIIKPGDRIAQGLILPVTRVAFSEVHELSETERGAGGFGSTGVSNNIGESK